MNEILLKTIYGYINVVERIGQRDIIAILFPGYSYPNCDYAYFMNELSKKLLVDKNISSLMVSPFGHGESDGTLADLTYDKLAACLTTVCNYAKKINKKNKICFISRGLFGYIPLCDNFNINKSILIYPSSTFELPYINYNSIQLCDDNFYQINRRVIKDSGAKYSNIVGQQINALLFEEIKSKLNKNTVNYVVIDSNVINCSSNDYMELPNIRNQIIKQVIEEITNT